MVSRLRSFAFLITLLVIVSMVIETKGSPPSEKRVISEIIDVFKDIETLSEARINVTKPINLLNEALDEARRCDSNATCWRDVRDKIYAAKKLTKELMEDMPSYTMWRNLRFYSAVAILASIPLAIYSLLPRAWTWLWVRNRRKWVVRRYRGDRE